MRPAVPAVAAAVLLLVVPAAADAANVSVTSGRLDYVALPGERNDARMSAFGGAVQVFDDNVPLTAGSGCTQEGPSFVRCPGVNRVDVELGDRDDKMDALASPAFTSLSVLRGGEGRDVITGTPGPDDLHGGPSDDELRGGPGADFFYGEDGTDLVSYSDRGGGAGINASLDGLINDGASGEGDHADPGGTVEMLEGGQGNDELKGNDGPFNRLDGGLGADLLDGRGGADQLLDSGFDAENDRLDGGAGSDDILFTTKSRGVTVDLAAGTAVLGAERNTVVNAERVFGTPEDDVMSGTAGEETFFAGLGDDWLDGRGGADDLRGDFGDDTVSYATRTAPVTATVAAFTTTFVNGEAGENDRIDRAERLEGGAGDDELMGAGGANVLTGGAGADTLRSFFGDDVLRGGEGDDQLDAGEGNDRLDGDAGADRVVGGPDDDTIAARDGATDVIDC